MKTRDGIAAVLWALCLALYLKGGGGLPVLTPVESPFPADGFYLLVGAESSDLTGAEMAANTEAIRKTPGLVRQVLDYSRIDSDRPPLPSPWMDALKWARDKSQGSPYYVVRNGSKASEGPLTGSPSEMLATLTAALEGVQ